MSELEEPRVAANAVRGSNLPQHHVQLDHVLVRRRRRLALLPLRRRGRLGGCQVGRPLLFRLRLVTRRPAPPLLPRGRRRSRESRESPRAPEPLAACPRRIRRISGGEQLELGGGELDHELAPLVLRGAARVGARKGHLDLQAVARVPQGHADGPRGHPPARGLDHHAVKRQEEPRVRRVQVLLVLAAPSPPGRAETAAPTAPA
mmetsp:Transcript_33600/g.75981  ORF Transcript_33600/g.75981 Transcript_33600/m.75981 type:complete len:204 (-) Transcript_33600:1940-2551(-)